MYQALDGFADKDKCRADEVFLSLQTMLLNCPGGETPNQEEPTVHLAVLCEEKNLLITLFKAVNTGRSLK